MKSYTISAGGGVKMDTDGLAKLRKELEKAKNARLEIGVLAGSTARTDGMSNADIGLAHEFGVVSKNLPERSFLRMPLIRELPQLIIATGRDAWRKAIIDKGVIFSLKSLGILAEASVQGAFSSGGFGRWRKLKKATIRRKGSSAILIDTAEMRQAITTRVVSRP